MSMHGRRDEPSRFLDGLEPTIRPRRARPGRCSARVGVGPAAGPSGGRPIAEEPTDRSGAADASKKRLAGRSKIRRRVCHRGQSGREARGAGTGERGAPQPVSGGSHSRSSGYRRHGAGRPAHGLARSRRHRPSAARLVGDLATDSTWTSRMPGVKATFHGVIGSATSDPVVPRPGTRSQPTRASPQPSRARR